MLGKTEKRVYLNISGGKVIKRTDRGSESFDYVEGELERIYRRDREFKGEKVPGDKLIFRSLEGNYILPRKLQELSPPSPFRSL